MCQSAAQGSPPDFDRVRHRYLADLHRHTDRNLVLYASGWLLRGDAPPAHISIRAFIKHHIATPPAQAVQIALDPNPPAG